MPPQASLQTLPRALAEEPTVSVLVAAEPEQEIILQRLNLGRNLAAEFLSTARDSVPGLAEVRIRPYEAGYKPDPDEIVYIDLRADEAAAEQIEQVSQVQQAELFAGNDNFIDHLRFYAIIVSPSARRRAVFFRTYSAKKELSRGASFGALLSHGSYNKVEEKLFLFDRETDCFAWDGYLFIKNVSAFQRIFGYFDALRANANATLDTVLARIHVSNDAAFRATCTGQMQMLAKMAQIARKPYLHRVTMRDIRRTIDDFHLDVPIVQEDGHDKLVFDGSPARRWLILKLLDDDYLGSAMTNARYEVNSKSALA